MSAPEWKPGDVAESTYRGVKSRAFVVEGRSCPREHPRNSPHWHGMTGGWNLLDDDAVTYRPLAVLDFAIGDVPAEQVREFVVGVLRQPRHSWTDAIADQIEAQAKPPKPAEPTGLGAVVEDADGVRWTRANAAGEWFSHNGDDVRFRWSDITAVRVLSEGVS